jgi:hypothetical protein
MVIIWWTSRADALYTFKTSISSCGPIYHTGSLFEASLQLMQTCENTPNSLILRYNNNVSINSGGRHFVKSNISFNAFVFDEILHINISLIRHTSNCCMVIIWWTSRADALYTFKTSISSCGPCIRMLTKPRRWQSFLHPSCSFSLS